MLTSLVAHEGELRGWHDLWWHWNADPLVLAGLAVVAWLYQRGGLLSVRPVARRRAAACWLGLAAIGVALLSPLDALSGQLASAHMVQHVLLVLVAAPLLALSAPVTVMLRGLPRRARGTAGRWRRAASRHAAWLPAAATAAAWLLHAGTLWVWHASVPYDAALERPIVHAAEHLTFLLTAVLFWASVARTARSRRASAGHGVLLVFTMGMQSVLLALLMTFATRPWYDGYRSTTARWGLDQLSDQQLAGAIMWVPAGFVYVAAGIILVAHWIRATERRLGHISSDWADAEGDRTGVVSVPRAADARGAGATHERGEADELTGQRGRSLHPVPGSGELSST